MRMLYFTVIVFFGLFHCCLSDATKCWTCESQTTFRDCRANGYLATCNAGDTGGCQTEIRNNNGVLSITKKCKAKSVCESEASCPSHFNDAGDICYFCCTADNCNVAVEGECVDNCQHVIQGDYHSCESCSKYRTCSYSVSAERDCAGGLVWNDKTKNCDWDYNSVTCPDYDNLGTAEAFKCWNCENEASFEACNANGYLQTCNEGDTGGCQTRISYQLGALDRVTKKCKQQQTCESEATNTDSRCPPSNQFHSANNMDCNFCCTTPKCNYVATDVCSDTCDGVSTTDTQSCIKCDVYITCTADPTDNRDCAMGQDGNHLDWDNALQTCVAASSTCPEGNSAVAGACDPNPCENDGTCSETESSYNCDCVQGYKGTDCDETDECDPDPCENDGVCTDGESSYTCDCATGYKGTDCDETDECDPDPCENDGVCTDGESSYTCDCATGYKGTDCAETDECDPDPCSANSISCVDGDNTYTCVCSQGYTGDNCQTADPNASVCDNDPCQNDGVCEEAGDSYTCDCATGFTGTNCDSTIEESTTPASSGGCNAEPCENGATCDDSGETYSCSCAAGFTGNNCQLEEGNLTCADSPCQNEAACEDTQDGGYTCVCTAYYTGTHCETYDSSLGGADAQGGETTAADESITGNDLFWPLLGGLGGALLLIVGCGVCLAIGRKPKKKQEEEEANGVPPAVTTMPHGPRKPSFTAMPRNSPAPVETVNDVDW